MKKHLLAVMAGMIAISLYAGPMVPAQASEPDATGPVVLPKPDPAFQGVIAETVGDSSAGTYAPPRAPEGAPNVLIVLTDDAGFGASSTFGGIVPTPNLDALAAQGARYNRFHVTAMCSPTRAALLTGRNPHAVGQGIVTPAAKEYPGYNGRFPRSAATIGRVLHDNGYDTAFIGKHHNIHKGRMSPMGPYDSWPTHLGFDYFYGFVMGETDQFSPALYEGTSRLIMADKPEDYILDRDLADKAIDWIALQDAADNGKPFFLYFATGSTHAPHQAPREWIERFGGQFDEGWDAARERIFRQQKAAGIIPANTRMTPRPDEIPAWDSLTGRQKKVYARFMEAYAAQLAFQDYQFGRIVDTLKRLGEFNDTLIIFIEGDNGASMEGGVVGKVIDYGQALNGLEDTDEWAFEVLNEIGGPQTAPLYPAGWAWAMNAPFPWGKRIASHLGGLRAGTVVSWPGHTGSPGMRDQYVFVSDVMPTVLEAAGIAAPDIVDGVEQQKLDGISFLYSLSQPGAPSRRYAQYYELLGNRGIYHHGWLANTTPPKGAAWQSGIDPGDVRDYKWELYNLAEDFAQADNLAGARPDKLRQLREVFRAEARENNVFPLANLLIPPPPRTLPARTYTYRHPVSLPPSGWPRIFGQSFTLTADLTTRGTGDSGVIASVGSHLGGWSFYLDKGHPAVTQAYSSREGAQFTIRAVRPLPTGASKIVYAFERDGAHAYTGGIMRIMVDGVEVARGRIERTIAGPLPDGETFDVGRDLGAPVVPAYSGLGHFPGELRQVEVRLTN